MWRFEGTKDEHMITHGIVELVFSDFNISRTTRLVKNTFFITKHDFDVKFEG